MDNLITVVALQGQAWTVAQDGSRRELRVGDTVAADEMVVTADGAQIDLQFANNQILTLIGEQEAPVDVAQFAEETVLSQPLAPINTETPTQAETSHSSHAITEGHGFVQLVRIHEIIEADGFTPLTVARIQEIIKPLGMVLPERDFEQDRWKENVSRNEHGSSREYSITISIDVIADDDIINAAEAQRDITVTGTVGGDVKPGDKVTVTVNGKTYETTVNLDGKTWEIDIPGSELVQDKTVEATVTGSTSTGKLIIADTERPYEVDTVLPKVDVELQGAGPDGIYNESEIVNGKVPALITLDKDTVKVGDQLVVKAPDGNVLLDRPVTQDDIDNGVPVQVPVELGQKTVIVEATITNPAGNSGHGIDEKLVDNVTPQLEIELQGAGPDGIYNESEIVSGEVPAKVTLDKDTVKVGDTLVVKTPDGNVLLDRPVTQDDIDNGVPVQVPVTPGQTTVTVEATITDPAGNSSNSTDEKPVDNITPTLKVELEGAGPDGVYNESEIVNDEVPAKVTLDKDTVKVGDTLVVKTPDGNVLLERPVTQGDIDNGVPVQVPVVPGQTTVTVEATVTDPAGNSGSSIDTKPVDNVTPKVVVELEGAGPDGIYNESEVVSGKVPAQVTLDKNTVSVGDTLKVTTPDGTVLLERPVTQGDIDNGVSVQVPVVPGQTTVTVEATITDPAGNSGSSTDTKPVDNLPPELVGALKPQDDTDADPISLDLSKEFNDVFSGKDLTFKATDLPKGLVIDPKTGVVSGTIDSSASQGGNTGTKGEYKVTITVIDPAGNSTEHDFVWTVTNPAPVATDDTQTIAEDTTAIGNVIKGTNSSGTGGGQDNDPDGDTLTVTGFTVDGDTTVYTAGDTVTIPNVGELTLNANGDYSFTPVKDWNGTVPNVNYIISDGEGGTSSADLKINVTPVNDAPVAITPATPLDQVDIDSDSATVTLDLPNLFKDVDGDTLTYEANGLPPGLIFNPVTGEITGSIDKSASQGGPNSDGKYTVTITAKDPSGDTAEQNFTWTVTNPTPDALDDAGETLKSIELAVDSANGVLKNDTDPDGDDLKVSAVTGIGGAPVANPDGSITVKGEYGTLTLQPNGSYVYTPDLANDTVWLLPAGGKLSDTFKYTVSDGEGGFDAADLVITINGHSNSPPFVTPEDENGSSVDGQLTVYEKGLAAGSEPGQGHIANSIINISALDGLSTITIAGQEITLGQLQGLSSTNTISIPVNGGTLILTGFDPLIVNKLGVDKTLGGKLSYSYELAADQLHTDADGKNSLLLDIQLGVKDAQGGVSVDADSKLIVNVIDDVPEAKADTNTISEDTAIAIGGNVLGGTGVSAGDMADAQGADGVTVTGVQSGAVAAGAHVDGGVTSIISGKYGTLKLNADGTYEYELDNTNLTVQGLGATEALTDEVFSYTITDKDGDKSTTTLTITINGNNDGVTVSVPKDHPVTPVTGNTADHVVFESGLSTGSNPIADDLKVNSSFTLKALDGLDPTSAFSIKYKDINGIEQTFTLGKDAIEALGATPQTIITQYGELTLNGYSQDTDPASPTFGTITISYNYELITAPKVNSDATNDEFVITVKDKDIDNAVGTISIKIIDDAPKAVNDTNAIDENTASVSGNVIGGTGASTGDNADTVGADGAAITGIVSNNAPANTATTDVNGDLVIVGKFGTVTIKADGSYTYVLDNDNLEVNGLKDTEVLSEDFTYTLRDSDLDEATATLTITINGKTDGNPGLIINDANGIEVGANSIAENATSPVTGTFTVTTPDGLKEINVKGKVVTAAELADLTANPVDINGTEGKLTLTGFNPATGEVTYSYQQTGTNKDHSGDKNKVTDSFTITVTDNGNVTTVPSDLTILITDTAPVAKPDINEVTEDSGVAATGNVISGTGADELGADAVTVTGVIKGTVTTELSGSVGGSGVPGEYGSIVIDALGNYTYTLNDSDPRVNALKTGEKLADTFSYTIKDADGDWSTTTVTITINGVTDAPPTITPVDGNDPLGGIAAEGQATVYESGLTTDGPVGQNKITTGEITVTAKDGLFSVTVGTKTLDLAQLNALTPGAPVIIDTDYGQITLTGFAPVLVDGITVGGELSYTYELTKPFLNTDPGNAGDENGFDNIVLQVKDASTSPAASGQLQINIIDDSPSIGTPTNATITEASLPGGSAENALQTKVTGGLAVRVGADSTTGYKAEVRFDTVQTALQDKGLSSGYDDTNLPIPMQYVVSADGYTLIAYQGAGRAETDKVFTATITDPNSSAAGYEFTLHKPLNHGTGISLDLPFGFSVKDGDNDPANNSFTITVTDDAPSAPGGKYELNIIEDSLVSTTANTFNTSADANPSNTVITVTGGIGLIVTDDANGGKIYTYPAGTDAADKTFFGSVTVNPNGSITYVPDSNYSNHGGQDSFIYTTTNGADVSVVTVDVNVKPVSDAPSMDGTDNPHAATVALTAVNTLEDTAVTLGLKTKTPKVTDKTDQNTGAGDAPERLGAITLTLTGSQVNGVKLTADADGVSAAVNHSYNGPITIWLTDVIHPTDVTMPAGALQMTSAQFEALKLLPVEHRSDNIDVSITAISYEVDDAGNIVVVGGTPVPGATSEATIKVWVQAVTDDAELTFNGVLTGTSVDVTGNTATGYTIAVDGIDPRKATITLDEDTGFKIKDFITAAFADLDGSEQRSITIANPTGSGASLYVFNGTGWVEVTPGNNVTINAKANAAGQTGALSSFPDIAIGTEPDFSGNLNGITITINAQDKDSDGFLGTTGTIPNPANGVSEGDKTNNSLTIDLVVKPVAGDVVAGNVTTLEDTPVDFLKEVRVTDTGTGTEVIDSVAFEIPTGWTLAAPANTVGSGWSVSGTGTAVDKYTITFDATLTEAQREAVLKGFTIKPPAHSSKDVTIDLTIKTTDTNGANTDTKTVTKAEQSSLAVIITVTPVAEKVGVDSDANSINDLTMIGSHAYTTTGFEDAWFALGVEGLFELGATGALGLAGTWSNEDVNEKIFALLTPNLIAGDGSQTSAIGSQFQWVEDGVTKTATFVGSPIEVPRASLASLEFMAAPNFAGKFEIKVQAKTVDFDDDFPGDLSKANIAISGESTLTNVLILPIADTSTTSLTARVEGKEDEAMALSIRPSSSDPSETFNVTISDIPVGATITYGTDSFTATAGNTSWRLTGFDKTKPMTVKPPLDSNENFTLKVSTVTVDKLEILGDPNSPYTSTSAPEELSVVVAPKGVADSANIVTSSPTFTEESVDTNGIPLLSTKVGGVITVQGLIDSASLKDVDGSETLTFKISGLPDGFSVVGATFIGGAGASREWSLSPAQLETAKIITPLHFNGTQSFDFYSVTTENDGDSLTVKHPVSVIVTPSPEAGMTLSSTIQEDISGKLAFDIIHKNNDAKPGDLPNTNTDNDEVLSEVWIKVADVEGVGKDFSLTLGEGGSSLAAAAGAAGSGVIQDDGWYKLSGTAINNIYALGKGNWHGDASLGVRYVVTDPGTTSKPTDATYSIKVTPVTDQVTAVITDGSDITLAAAGEITVKLNVGNTGADYDGSEKLTRIILENVPDGVVLLNPGSDFIGNGTWVIVTNTPVSDGLSPELKLQVYGSANQLINHPIKVTVVSEDAGNEQETRADVSFNLSTNFVQGEPDKPAKIDTWLQKAFEPTEEKPFTLEEAIDAKIDATGVTQSGFTVTLTDLPVGTTVTGMTKTIVEGKEVWSASGSGDDAALQTLLSGITVTAPKDWNTNKGSFDYNATLTTHVPSGGRAQEPLAVKQTVIPVTDDAVITITMPDVNEGSTVAITVDITNPADNPAWTLIGDTLYLKVVEPAGMVGGTLTAAGGGALTKVGDYYEVPLSGGTSVNVVYVPKDGYVSGKVTLEAKVKGQETGAAELETVKAQGFAVLPVNSDYDLQVVKVTGVENSTASDKTKAIEVKVTGSGLADKDGSESIETILLKNIPNDFLVFIGTSAADAQLASLANNAGGSAGTNTWLIGNAMPGYIGILPPKNWSGTLTGLELVVVSGEGALPDKKETSAAFDFEVAPVANGMTLTPTASFGKEGAIIPLNLNAEMKDLYQAGVTDSSIETATLQFKGLGEFTSFYIDGVLAMDKVAYDKAAGVYTISSLSQDNIDKLGFVQAQNDIGSLQVRGQTVESANGNTSDWTHPDAGAWAGLTTTITQQLSTTGSDTLLWTGNAINGLGVGDTDTIQLRFGESLSSNELANHLKNIEVIDLGIAGANQVGDATDGLSIQDVLDMTDSREALKIDGDSLDSVFLSNEWIAGSTTAGYIAYTGAGGVTVNIAEAMLPNITLVD